ncbi:MAG: SRPBCC family protein [Caldimonas sp.]
MTHPLAVAHDTIVVERRFPVSPEKAFAAFADAEQRARWHFPGEDWELVEFEQDFRVGGHEHSVFGPKGAANLRDEGTFLDIVQNRRIVSAGTMHQDDVRISLTLCTVEFAADGDGTTLKLTDQSAFLDGREKPEERRNGWGKVLQRLERHLMSPRAKGKS